MHSPTTYTIRPYFNAHHWQVWYATEDGEHGAHTGPVKTLKQAISQARDTAVDGYDKIFIRKRLSVGRNAGAWHRVDLVDPNLPVVSCKHCNRIRFAGEECYCPVAILEAELGDTVTRLEREGYA